MYLTDLFKQIVFSLWMHKIRTCLALFGIVWGTVSVILLLALSKGFYEGNIKNLAFLNNGTIFAWPGVTSKPFAGFSQGKRIHIRSDDFLSIAQNIPGIKAFSPVYYSERMFQYQDKHINVTIQGVAAGYQDVQQLQPFPGGRFINVLDEKKKEHVVFLDNEAKKLLFGTQEALGKTLTIQGIPFVVIGVADPAHNNIMMWMTNTAYIPYSTYLSLWGQQDIGMFFIQPDSMQQAARIKQNIKNLFALRYQYDPVDEQALHFPNMEDAQVFFQWFFRGIELFLGFCGVLTLSVGGLGTANMMFLIVTERTREIGLRMALGAEQTHIMLQFMLESLVLVALGGFIGFMIAWFFLALLHQLPLPVWLGSPHISWSTAIMTICVLATVGVLAGYFPARRAANMEPVKALAF